MFLIMNKVIVNVSRLVVLDYNKCFLGFLVVISFCNFEYN